MMQRGGRWKPALLCILAFLLLNGCAGHQQSAVDPVGPQSGKIAGLWWFFVAVLGAIFIIVMAFTLLTLIRRHRGIEQEPLEAQHHPSEQTEQKLTRIVAGATIATVVILFVLLVSSVGTGKALSALGRPVMIRGTSQDVIHSFWAPNLHGKRDLIPSRITTQWIQADSPGAYRGQCAEFCGLQHAHMALWVIAEPQVKFDAWMSQQLQSAVPPSDPVKQRGQQVFMNHACIYCHSIRGTTASGQVAPDLTHFGSRRSIAAGTLPNNKGNLGGWITDPQSVKPGNHMATIAVNSQDLQPLLEYIESLK
jgi:cytochrome c oxidase subunit II